MAVLHRDHLDFVHFDRTEPGSSGFFEAFDELMDIAVFQRHALIRFVLENQADFKWFHPLENGQSPGSWDVTAITFHNRDKCSPALFMVMASKLR